MAEEEKKAADGNGAPIDDAPITQGVLRFADYDVRGIGMQADMEAKITGETIAEPIKFIEIPTPAWFPESLLRNVKRNLYLRMVNDASYANKVGIDAANATGDSLDFYRESSSSGLLMNMVNSSLRSIVTTAANQVMSVMGKVDAVKNGLSSLVGRNPGAGSSRYDIMDAISTNPFLQAQPYITLHGIHISENIKDVYNAIVSFGKAFSASFKTIFSKDTSSEGFLSNIKNVFNDMNAGLSKALVALGLTNKSVDAEGFGEFLQTQLADPKGRMHNVSEAQLLASISGIYTLSGKLPFFGNAAPMLTSSGTRAFNRRNGSDFKSINDINEIVSKYMSTTFFSPLDFIPGNMINDRITPVNYSFNIFNDTIEHVILNLAFIFSFGATTQAVTDFFTLRPPYLFDVEIPGGLMYKYCICTLKITPQGKLRRLARVGENFRTSDKSVTADDLETNKFMKDVLQSVFGFDSINTSAITHVPDYYKVDVTFESSLPNMWNFIDSYIRSERNVPVVGDTIKHMLANAVTAFSGEVIKR